jgi:ABC-type polar amino acid transport system ATPase subunit
MGFAREVADTVSVMDRGVVLESGSPAQIFETPKHPRTREFLQAVTWRGTSAGAGRHSEAGIPG